MEKNVKHFSFMYACVHSLMLNISISEEQNILRFISDYHTYETVFTSMLTHAITMCAGRFAIIKRLHYQKAAME